MKKAWWLADLVITLAVTAFMAVFTPFVAYVTFQLNTIEAGRVLVATFALLSAIAFLALAGCCLTLRDLVMRRPSFRRSSMLELRNTTPR